MPRRIQRIVYPSLGRRLSTLWEQASILRPDETQLFTNDTPLSQTFEEVGVLVYVFVRVWERDVTWIQGYLLPALGMGRIWRQLNTPQPAIVPESNSDLLPKSGSEVDYWSKWMWGDGPFPRLCTRSSLEVCAQILWIHSWLRCIPLGL